MKAIATYFKNRINLWLLPLLLMTAVGKVLVDCYATDSKTLYTAAFFGLSLGVFALLDLLYRLKKLGGLIYTVILIAVLMLSMRSVFRAEYYGGAGMTFQQWFYGALSNGQEMIMPYFLALFFGGGFFLCSVLYYFTQIQYRAIGTLLMIFIPFVIYAKRDDTMSDLTITLLITLFIAMIVHDRIFLDRDGGKGTLVNTAYVLSVSLFVTVTGALAMVFPDLSTESRLEKDASFLAFRDISAGSGSSLSNPDSSTRFHGAEYTNEPIFYLYPEDMSKIEYPIYLRRRSMNAYDASLLDWYASSDLKRVDESAESTLSLSFASLYNAERYKGQHGLLGGLQGVPENAFEKDIEEQTYSFELEFDPDVGTVSYIPFPMYSSVTMQDAYGDEVAVPMRNSDFHYIYPYRAASDLGRIKLTASKTRADAEAFAEKAGMSFRDFWKDVDEANSVSPEQVLDDDGNIKEDSRFEFHIGTNYDPYYSYVYNYYNYAPTYLKDNGLKDYDRIKELADEIVKDCTSDYEKAKAIEEYFTNEGFVYDLEYIPEDESVSYFLFESRRGICIDFASAMGVMLIMEGVPCRYVEGFVAYERDADDPSRLIVRDANAHAFIEAFIPYAGWMTFDPTVAGYMREFDEGEKDTQSGFMTVFMQYLGRVLLVLGVLFVLVFIVLFDRLWEIVFRIRLSFMTPERKLTALYRHIFRLLEYEDKTDLKPYTARLLNDYLRRKTGSSLTSVTDLFEQHRFGNREVDDAQFGAAYADYKKLLPLIRKKGTKTAG